MTNLPADQFAAPQAGEAQEGGVWVVWYRDWDAEPLAVFRSEIEALRWANDEARFFSPSVDFWRFETEWESWWEEETDG